MILKIPYNKFMHYDLSNLLTNLCCDVEMNACDCILFLFNSKSSLPIEPLQRVKILHPRGLHQ